MPKVREGEFNKMRKVTPVKTTFVVAILVSLVGAFARAQTTNVTGTLVDNACRLEGMTAEQLAKHDRGCLQMGVCVKSGYSIVTDEGKAFTLDAKGNALAAAEIKKSTRKTDFKATVTGLVKGETIAAASITIDK